MAGPAKKNSSVVTYKPKKTIALCPGILGYSSLIEPDTYDPEKPTFKLNLHISAQAIDNLKEIIASKVYTDEALEALKEEAEKAKIAKIGSFKDPELWLEAKLKEAREGKDPSNDPYIVIANKATYKDKEGETHTKKVAAWDAKNTKLDLKKLRLGRGSLIVPVVYPNIFFSKLNGDIQPSLKLVGVKVLKLKTFSRGAAQEVETDEASIREVLGDEFAFEDLTSFALGGDDDQDHSEVGAPEDEASRLFGGE